MRVGVLLVSLLVVSSVSPAVPTAAATATPAVRLVGDFSMVYFVAGTTVEDQVDRVSDGPGPAFADIIGTSVTGPSGTSSVTSEARNLAVRGPGESPSLLEIDGLSSIAASTTADDTEAEGTPYASAWSVYTADFTVASTVPYHLQVDVAAKNTNVYNCAYVKVWLTGPEGIVYDLKIAVGDPVCDNYDREVGALDGSLSRGKYRLHLDVLSDVDASTGSASTAAHAGVNLQLGRGCDNDPTAEGGPVTGTAASDVLCGGFGPDEIDGRGGDDLILSGPGNDVVTGGSGHDAVYGSDGLDHLDGGDGSDVLAGEQGADAVRGEGGRDAIDGGTGADQLAGGSRADRIIGGPGADTIAAGLGDDTVRACDDTKDVLRGELGVDAVHRDPFDDSAGFATRALC
jgi:Ca2+-binding RTX toxin-like protein